MITRNDVVRLLALAAAYDQRTNGEEDVQAWLLVAQRERWTYTAVQAVIVEHYSRSTDRPRLTPAAVSDRLRTMRGRAAESFDPPRIPDDLPNAEYPAWLRRQLAAHCDAHLERWAATGEEPPRAIQAAPAAVGDLGQLVTRAPLRYRRAISAGVEPIETAGQAFAAAYDGFCQRSGDRIEVGDRIARVDEGTGYVHAGRCPA